MLIAYLVLLCELFWEFLISHCCRPQVDIYWHPLLNGDVIIHLLDAVSHVHLQQAISHVIMHFTWFIVACFVLDIYGYFGVLLSWRLLFTTLVCPTHSSHYRTNVLFTTECGLFFVIMLPALDLHLTFFGFRFLLGVYASWSVYS